MPAALVRVALTLTAGLLGGPPRLEPPLSGGSLLPWPGSAGGSSAAPFFGCLAARIGEDEEAGEDAEDGSEEDAEQTEGSATESDEEEGDETTHEEEGANEDEASEDDADAGDDSEKENEGESDEGVDTDSEASADDDDSSSASEGEDSDSSDDADASEETTMTTTTIEFDCDDGYESGAWKSTWSSEKKSWCCKSEKKGCKGKTKKRSNKAKKKAGKKKQDDKKHKKGAGKAASIPPECSMTRRQYMDLDMCQDQNIALWSKFAGIEDKGSCHDDENGIKICTVSIECDGGQKSRTPVIESHRSLTYDCSVCDKNGNEVLRIPCCQSCEEDVEKAKKRKFFVRKNLIDEVQCKGCDASTLNRIGKENQDICQMTDSGFRCKMDKTCQTGEPAKVVTDRSYDCETTPCNTCKDEAARAQCCLHCLRDSCNNRGGDDKNRTVCLGCSDPPAAAVGPVSFVSLNVI